MAEFENLYARPEFDLEEFMNLSQETRLSQEALAGLGDLWEKWHASLKTVHIKAGRDSWLAIWLPEEVESEVDEAWRKSPGEGYLINSLAQYLCMAAVNSLLPQIVDAGCAPCPAPDIKLKQALDEIGLGQPGGEDLSVLRRYAILTHYPFRGGCEICALQADCPKHKGEQGFASVVLPGYERGRDD